VLVRRAGDQQTTRFTDTLQPRCNIDSFAEDVVAFDQHVAEMDADAINDFLAVPRFGVARDHELLNRYGALNGVDHRGELQQQPIAHRFDNAAASVRNQRPRRLAMIAHRPRRPDLVLAHQPGIADNIHGHNRGEFAGFSHCASHAALNLARGNTKRITALGRLKQDCS
jgi:hypothetical protein